jgi:hypothetical protein
LLLVELAMAAVRCDGEVMLGGKEPDVVGLAWLASTLEEASMLCTSRASGSSVHAEIRGIAAGDACGCSRSVAARRTSRRRPSGNATAMKAGPRAQVSDSSFSC